MRLYLTLWDQEYWLYRGWWSCLLWEGQQDPFRVGMPGLECSDSSQAQLWQTRWSQLLPQPWWRAWTTSGKRWEICTVRKCTPCDKGRNYLGLSGTTFDYLWLSGTIWNYPGQYRFILVFCNLSGTMWDYLGLSGTISDYTRLSGTIWEYMGLYGTIWD